MLTPAVEMSRRNRDNLLNFLAFAHFWDISVNCLKTGRMEAAWARKVTPESYHSPGIRLGLLKTIDKNAMLHSATQGYSWRQIGRS